MAKANRFHQAGAKLKKVNGEFHVVFTCKCGTENMVRDFNRGLNGVNKCARCNNKTFVMLDQNDAETNDLMKQYLNRGFNERRVQRLRRQSVKNQ